MAGKTQNLVQQNRRRKRRGLKPKLVAIDDTRAVVRVFGWKP